MTSRRPEAIFSCSGLSLVAMAASSSATLSSFAVFFAIILMGSLIFPGGGRFFGGCDLSLLESFPGLSSLTSMESGFFFDRVFLPVCFFSSSFLLFLSVVGLCRYNKFFLLQKSENIFWNHFIGLFWSRNFTAAYCQSRLFFRNELPLIFVCNILLHFHQVLCECGFESPVKVMLFAFNAPS